MTLASIAERPHPPPPRESAAARPGGPDSRENRRWHRIFLPLGALVIVCQILLMAAVAYQWRKHELREAEAQLRSDVVGLTEHAVQSLNALDAVSLGLVDAALTEGTAWFDRYDEDVVIRMNDHIDDFPHIRGAVTIAPSGMSVNDGVTDGRHPLDLSDRPYFQIHRQDPDHGLYLGQPLLSRATGEWFLPATRAVVDAEGTFLGVILLTVEPQYFASFYARLSVQPINRAILSADGTLLSAYSPDGNFEHDRALGRTLALPDGVSDEGIGFRDLGLIAPVPSLVRIARVPGWDWFIVAEMPMAVALADWDEMLLAIGGIGMLGVLVFVAAFLWIGRNHRLLSRAYDTISQQNAALEGHYRELQETNRDLAEARNQCDLQRQEMEKLAMTDALTGIANRRSFAEMAASEVRRARRYGNTISVITFDVDRFKSVNDAFGHAVGDEVLRAIADTVATQLRCCDLLARMGGEEFAVLLPQTRLRPAAGMAQRIRAAVARMRVPSCPDDTVITISLGVAEWTPGEQSIDATLSRADEALYRAKAAGRNRVCTDAPAEAAPEAATVSV